MARMSDVITPIGLRLIGISALNKSSGF